MAAPTPRPERRFYSEDRAIGRLGMRIFEPQIMPAPHAHGHIEANFLSRASMTYLIDDHRIEVPPNRLVLFWASVPHQLVAISPDGADPARLANLYLPLDLFLFLPHIGPLQDALLSGAVVAVEPGLFGEAQIAAWYRDYRSGVPERREILFMELNAALRRAQLGRIEHLRAPGAGPGGSRRGRSRRMVHLVAMLRFILENLNAPIANADVARVTGLHTGHAVALFTAAMQMPPHRFIIRMRLLRARALLFQSADTVASVALRSGFASPSQFYDHFARAYGTTPQAMRDGRV
jgi:AraC-like DNA-binding protein